MVDPIGLKPIPTSERTVAAVTRTPATTPASMSDTVVSTTVTTAHDLAAAPPVDYDRVARIRKAIAEGSFPILPARIADRLIAAKFDWVRHDEA